MNQRIKLTSPNFSPPSNSLQLTSGALLPIYHKATNVAIPSKRKTPGESGEGKSLAAKTGILLVIFDICPATHSGQTFSAGCLGEREGITKGNNVREKEREWYLVNAQAKLFLFPKRMKDPNSLYPTSHTSTVKQHHTFQHR